MVVVVMWLVLVIINGGSDSLMVEMVGVVLIGVIVIVDSDGDGCK